MKTVLNFQKCIDLFTDKGSFKGINENPSFYDPLQWTFFTDYSEKIKEVMAVSGLQCGLLWGECTIEKHPAIIIINEFSFIGGSLATAEADAIVKAIDYGIREKLPVIWFASSGGCRIYEGIYSLHCISKIINARNALGKAHIPLITVSMNPLYGGANVCSTLADINIGVKDAHIGFAGVNVIKSIEKFPLPSDFQTSEYAFAHGHLDEVLQSGDIKSRLAQILRIFFKNRAEVSTINEFKPDNSVEHIEPWNAVQFSRSNKIKTDKLVSNVFDDFYELHGDRISADDSAIIAGIGRIGNRTFAIV